MSEKTGRFPGVKRKPENFIRILFDQQEIGKEAMTAIDKKGILYTLPGAGVASDQDYRQADPGRLLLR